MLQKGFEVSSKNVKLDQQQPQPSLEIGIKGYLAIFVWVLQVWQWYLRPERWQSAGQIALDLMGSKNTLNPNLHRTLVSWTLGYLCLGSYVAPAWCRWFAGLGAYYASPNCWSIDSFSVRRSLVSVQKPETRRDPWTRCPPFPNEIHALQPTKLSWLCTSKFKWILLTIRDFYCHACLPHCMNPNEFKIS